MAGVEWGALRVVGGNDKLVAMKRVNREARWPPLRVVQTKGTPIEPLCPRAIPERPWTSIWTWTADGEGSGSR